MATHDPFREFDRFASSLLDPRRAGCDPDQQRIRHRWRNERLHYGAMEEALDQQAARSGVGLPQDLARDVAQKRARPRRRIFRRHPIGTLIPPSAITTDPTMKLARSEARNATISAISRGSAARPIGALPPCSARNSRPSSRK